MSRLPVMPDEWINRSHTVKIRFEGREYVAFEGDAISSALWAAGTRTLGRSFKYTGRVASCRWRIMMSTSWCRTDSA